MKTVIRKRVAVLAVLACITALSAIPAPATAHGRHTIRRYTLSHNYPEGSKEIYLCAGMVINRGHGLDVKVVSGPAPANPVTVSGFARGDSSNTIVVVGSFRITEPGTYRVRARLLTRRGAVLRRIAANYTVPAAPAEGEARFGPIECPPPEGDSFPE